MLVGCLGLGLAVGCATSNAGKVCSPVASWAAPAYECVTPAAPVSMKSEPAAAPAAKAEIKGERIELKEMVEFKTGSHELANETDAVLDEVVRILKSHPEIARVRIEGHTDSTGTRELNQKLSEERAATVKAYLVGHGIEAGRVTSKGMGQDRPIADNASEAGRTQNRRVEIHVEERR